MIISMIVLRNARLFYATGSFLMLGCAAPMIYGAYIILVTEFKNIYQQILIILLIMLIIEWIISYSYQKTRLQKAIEQMNPNNAIDIEKGSLDLQQALIFSSKDANESWGGKILNIGRILMCFAPAIGAAIYRSFSFRQQSAYFAVALSSFSVLFISFSGLSLGNARVIDVIEKKEKRIILIKKLE
jgi:hypothetical protein